MMLVIRAGRLKMLNQAKSMMRFDSRITQEVFSRSALARTLDELGTSLNCMQSGATSRAGSARDLELLRDYPSDQCSVVCLPEIRRKYTHYIYKSLDCCIASDCVICYHYGCTLTLYAST